eukprot:Nk52_evm23s490 gene=Nk52_evmTU23s490
MRSVFEEQQASTSLFIDDDEEEDRSKRRDIITITDDFETNPADISLEEQLHELLANVEQPCEEVLVDSYILLKKSFGRVGRFCPPFDVKLKAKVFEIFSRHLVQLSSDQLLQACLGAVEAALVSGFFLTNDIFARPQRNGQPATMLKSLEKILFGLLQSLHDKQSLISCMKASFALGKQMKASSTAFTEYAAGLVSVFASIAETLPPSVNVKLLMLDCSEFFLMFYYGVNWKHVKAKNSIDKDWVTVCLPFLSSSEDVLRNKALRLLRQFSGHKIIASNDDIKKMFLTFSEELSEDTLATWRENNGESYCLGLIELMFLTLGTALHRGRLINKLLKTVEFCMKSRSPSVRLQSLRVWEALIENFSHDQEVISEYKRVKLVMTAFRILEKDTDYDVILGVTKCWWKLIVHLRSAMQSNVTNVILPFIRFCFGGSDFFAEEKFSLIKYELLRRLIQPEEKANTHTSSHKKIENFDTLCNSLEICDKEILDEIIFLLLLNIPNTCDCERSGECHLDAICDVWKALLDSWDSVKLLHCFVDSFYYDFSLSKEAGRPRTVSCLQTWGSSHTRMYLGRRLLMLILERIPWKLLTAPCIGNRTSILIGMLPCNIKNCLFDRILELCWSLPVSGEVTSDGNHVFNHTVALIDTQKKLMSIVASSVTPHIRVWISCLLHWCVSDKEHDPMAVENNGRPNPLSKTKRIAIGHTVWRQICDSVCVNSRNIQKDPCLHLPWSNIVFLLIFPLAQERFLHSYSSEVIKNKGNISGSSKTCDITVESVDQKWLNVLKSSVKVLGVLGMEAVASSFVSCMCSLYGDSLKTNRYVAQSNPSLDDSVKFLMYSLAHKIRDTELVSPSPSLRLMGSRELMELFKLSPSSCSRPSFLLSISKALLGSIPEEILSYEMADRAIKYISDPSCVMGVCFFNFIECLTAFMNMPDSHILAVGVLSELDPALKLICRCAGKYDLQNDKFTLTFTKFVSSVDKLWERVRKLIEDYPLRPRDSILILRVCSPFFEYVSSKSPTSSIRRSSLNFWEATFSGVDEDLTMSLCPFLSSPKGTSLASELFRKPVPKGNASAKVTAESDDEDEVGLLASPSTATFSKSPGSNNRKSYVRLTSPGGNVFNSSVLRRQNGRSYVSPRPRSAKKGTKRRLSVTPENNGYHLYIPTSDTPVKRRFIREKTPEEDFDSPSKSVLSVTQVCKSTLIDEDTSPLKNLEYCDVGAESNAFLEDIPEEEESTEHLAGRSLSKVDVVYLEEDDEKFESENILEAINNMPINEEQKDETIDLELLEERSCDITEETGICDDNAEDVNEVTINEPKTRASVKEHLSVDITEKAKDDVLDSMEAKRISVADPSSKVLSPERNGEVDENRVCDTNDDLSEEAEMPPKVDCLENQESTVCLETGIPEELGRGTSADASVPQDKDESDNHLCNGESLGISTSIDKNNASPEKQGGLTDILPMDDDDKRSGSPPKPETIQYKILTPLKLDSSLSRVGTKSMPSPSSILKSRSRRMSSPLTMASISRKVTFNLESNTKHMFEKDPAETNPNFTSRKHNLSWKPVVRKKKKRNLPALSASYPRGLLTASERAVGNFLLHTKENTKPSTSVNTMQPKVKPGVLFAKEGPIYPECIDAKDSISVLKGPNISKGTIMVLRTRGIYTVGDLCRMNGKQAKTLKIPEASLESTLRVFAKNNPKYATISAPVSALPSDTNVTTLGEPCEASISSNSEAT